MPRRRRLPRPPASEPRITEYRVELDDGLEELRGLLDEPVDELRERAPAQREPEAVQGPLGRAWRQMIEATHGRVAGGREYLRGGAVLDLQVQRGLITAEVQGTRRYRVKIAVSLPIGEQHEQLRAGLMGVAELSGAALTDAIAAAGEGAVPAPRHLVPFCPCLDRAPFCKHTCAALFGVGLRIDRDPGLLLLLRGLAPDAATPAPRPVLLPLAPEKALHEELAGLFGIDLIAAATSVSAGPASAASEAATSEAAIEAPPSGLPEVGRERLRGLGVAPHVIDAWLREGVLRRTQRPGIYAQTAEATRRLAALAPLADENGD